MNRNTYGYITGIVILLLVGIPLIITFSGRNPLAFVAIPVVIHIIRAIIINILESINSNSDIAGARRRALNAARIYLAPYDSIWKNLKLTNRYVVVSLKSDGETIECQEKAYPYRCMRIGPSVIFSMTQIWDMMCTYFSWNKTYDGIVEDCNRMQIRMNEWIDTNRSNSKAVLNKQNQAAQKQIIQKENEKTEAVIDVNNCSEIELTELPGISIVLAKKVINKREEIGGFKTVGDFFLFLKLKPHLIEQLKNRVTVGKMKGTIHKKINTERSVDF